MVLECERRAAEVHEHVDKHEAGGEIMGRIGLLSDESEERAGEKDGSLSVFLTTEVGEDPGGEDESRIAGVGVG